MRPLRIKKYTIAALALCFSVVSLFALPPSYISLTANTVNENQSAGTVVGALSTNPGIIIPPIFTIVSGGTYFGIVGTNLVTKVVFNYEDPVKSYDITIRANNGDGTFDEHFTIWIIDVNDAPTDIDLSENTVDEGKPVNTVIGTLSTTDEDAGDNHTYSLVTGGSDFNISGNELRTSRIFDFETEPSFDITIRTTDDGIPSLYFDKLFTIYVLDINEPPVASDVTIIGPGTVNNIHTGDYTFDDPDEDDEVASTYQWYSANTIAGARTLISGETGISYTPGFNMGGKYIQFEVTPMDEHGMAGEPVSSERLYIDAAPVFTDLTVINETNPGVFALGETVTANTDSYDDKEDDDEGTHTYQWYRSSNKPPAWPAAAISGATGSTYTLVSPDNNKNIAVRVVPYAQSGSSPGEADTSAWYSVSELPSAIISGDVTICEGSEGILTVTLTGSNPPWAFSYTIDGGSPIEVTDVETSPYDLVCTEEGTYELVEVSDEKFDHGPVSGEGTISYHPTVSATLTEEEYYVCIGDEEEHELPVTLTGTSPWTFSYRKIGDPPADSLMRTGITQTSSFIPVTAEDIGTFEILHVWDVHCMAEGTGSTEVMLRGSPIGTMSGDTSVCPGQPANLHVELTGTGPWNFWYTLDGGTEIQVYVTSHPAPYVYEFQVSETGLYELTRVSDNENEGCAYESATVLEHALPTATIPGSGTICEDTEVDVELEGTYPWSFTYQNESEDPVTVTGIEISPYSLEISEGGTYTILEVTDKNCTNSDPGTSIEVEPEPPVYLYGLEQGTYSFESDPIPVSVDPYGGNFDESDFRYAFIPNGPEWTFYPNIAYTYSPFHVVYSWEDPSTGCIGRARDTVYIVEQDAEIQVLNPDPPKNRYCFNDEAILIEGVNIRQEIGSFSIEGNEGLDDPDPDDNEAFLIPSIIQSGTRTVTYSVYFPGEGWKYASKDFTFQKIDADFTWDNECFGDGESLVNFYDNSDGGSAVLDSFRWTFYFPDEPLYKDGSMASVTFDEMITYPVRYIVGSENGCFDTINKDLILKPIIPVFESPYAEDFTAGRSNWYSYAVNSEGLNSWKFGRPLGETFNTEAGTKAWYTDVQNILNGEQSYVVSPCYDFSGSSRPVIRMDIWRAFASIDGAVLQYTLDNGENWFEVGAIDDGIYWYNEYNIFGIPGGQGLGWTNKKDANWVKARHKLDMLEGESLVRFRIAYGAPNGYPDERDGIAFDNIWIGERTKKVLIEHFTNAGDTMCKRVNEEFNTLVNSNGNLEDIIDLQYHMGYPGADTFYYLNPGPPDTREYYYSLANVPYAFIDGGRNGMPEYLVNYREEELEQIDLTLSVLYDNPFLFNMNTILGDNSLTVNLEVEAAEDFEEKALTVYVVIIERLIKDVVGANGEDRFESVVRDMLPNSQGTSINRSWSPGDKEFRTFDWFFQDVFDDEELRVVAFIQDDMTKEVYQAEIINPYAVSGIEDIIPEEKNRMVLYPNPAYDHVVVSLKEKLRGTAILKLTDYTGRNVYSRKLNRGEQLINVSLDEFDSGLYIVTLYDEKNILFSEKLVVIDNK